MTCWPDNPKGCGSPECKMCMFRFYCLPRPEKTNMTKKHLQEQIKKAKEFAKEVNKLNKETESKNHLNKVFDEKQEKEWLESLDDIREEEDFPLDRDLPGGCQGDTDPNDNPLWTPKERLQNSMRNYAPIEQLEQQVQRTKNIQKIDFSLMPVEFHDVVLVLQQAHESGKYEKNGWQEGKNFDEESNNSSKQHHLDDVRQGNYIDKESGLDADLHLACRSLMSYTLRKRGKL